MVAKNKPDSFLTALMLLIFAFSLVGCASLIPAPHETPAVNRFFLHDNPSVGDYAIHGDKNNALKLTKRYEVFAIDNEGVTVRWRMFYGKTGYAELAPQEWYYRLLDRDGFVKKAWAIRDDNKYFDTPVASEGEIGSLENYRQTKQFEPESIWVEDKQIAADSLHFYTARTDAVFVAGGSMILEYQSAKVPFRMLKRHVKSRINTGLALRSFEALVAAGEAYQSRDPLSIRGKVSAAETDYDSTFSLLEYGFSGN